MLWRFKFSQLKGSSDDGKARVKLLFQSLDTKQIEMKVGTPWCNLAWVSWVSGAGPAVLLACGITRMHV